MKAIIMAGGKGSRISPYKPILEICGYPMYYWVYRSLREFAEEIYLAITPWSSLIFSEIPKVITYGNGYENDVIEAVRQVGFPVIVSPSDTPLIPKHVFMKLISDCRAQICSIKDVKDYVGISLWKSLKLNEYQDILVEEEILNVNTPEDYRKVKNICNNIDKK
ncbi:GTP:adenosylcobinamide-phosphate guanylyltransferase [Sulfolobus acidocaldarius SUSAZ]|nr:GTP:adenosylcobinamide-phosphate guanylyltransferase [Sulfolobus acidocaldarius SUSAZ]